LNIFLFVIAFVCFTLVSAYYHAEITDAFSTNSFLKKISGARKTINSTAVGTTVFLFFIAMCDAVKIIDFGNFSGTYTFMGIAGTLSFILYQISSRKNSEWTAFASKAVLIASVLELTVFNVCAYRTWFGDYKYLYFPADKINVTKGAEYSEDEGKIVKSDSKDDLTFEFPAPDIQITNFCVDIEFGDATRFATVMLDVTDEAQTTMYRKDIAKGTVVKGKDKSNYIYCDISGKVGYARIRISTHNNFGIKVNGVEFNVQAPFEISWIRFMLIVVISIVIHEFLKGKTLKKSFEKNMRLCRTFGIIITAGACISAFTIVNHKLDGRKWSDEFKQTKGTEVTQQLVEAFENGRTYLVPEPDENLKEFENLYDTGERDQHILGKYDDYYENIWDHVYYNGKFYSYYGIAPVILLCMPYHLITGYFIPENLAVLIFSLIGFIGLGFMYFKFFGKLFSDLPSGFYIISYIILQTSCGIWFSLGRPLFYEIATSAGFAFLTWALYFALSANIIGKGKISLPKTAVSSLFFATAVLSRPTTVLYCICVALYMILASPRAVTEHGTGDVRPVKFGDYVNSRTAPYLLCALLPMAVLGLVQMIYNASRFGSPFEFGIQYSLTINNFTKTQFHWRLSLIPLYNYLFSTPIFSVQYPLVTSHFDKMGVNGFFYDDYSQTYSSTGVFFSALPMFAYFLSGKALKYIPERKERVRKAVYVGIPCVLIPLVIIASVWESGYAIRYMVDFAWQMLLGAYVIVFFIYRKTGDKTVMYFIRAFFSISLVWTLYVCGNQILEQALRYSDMHWDYPEIMYEIEKIFSFWK